jgi:hypothetical protein
MYNPSRDQVRQFFCDTWAKYRQNIHLEGLETKAIDIILLHPEYHGLLTDRGGALEREYTPETAEANPFLHLSLHLAVEEQLSINQPPGISAEFARLLQSRGARHDALHDVLECLGETVWRSQRDAAPPDADAYLDCIRKR